MAKYDDLDTRQIFVIGIGSVLVTIVTILAVQYVYFLLVDAHQTQLQADSKYTRQNQVLAEQMESISRYGADEATGNAVMPIENAMQEVIKEANSHDHADDNESDAT
ncbi:hypothetical protein LOC67_06020 [Stieleria sp. JC731]|uniref:hypothetical protein n=1 Tax=Pirellulaceae TaxID=2691357 RepID=UPI001E3E61C7|nr:hypothetical protein [Stieleria sp. JC731]MCC9600109.1 hypothetical protein [Stieleria sp. JC731]